MKTIFKFMRGSIQFLPTLGLLTGLAACTDYLDEFKDEYDETFAAIEDPSSSDDEEPTSSETKAGTSSSAKLSSSDKGSEPADGSSSSGKVGSSSSTKGTSSSSQNTSSDSMDDIPLSAGVFGTCAPVRANFELDERVTWSFTWNTETSGLSSADIAKATLKWSMPGGTPATYDGDANDRFIETSYTTSGTKTASVSVTAQGSTQEITCSPVMVIPATESSSSDSSSPEFAPTRVGPVSQYGELITGKNSSGKGQIYGSCEGVKDGAEVQVRGMSLFKSIASDAMDFWTEEGVTTMVNDMKIQIVRAPMAVSTGSWSDEWNEIQLKGYLEDPDNQKSFVKMVVDAAIKNDIYVIIDWNSNENDLQTGEAIKFFKEMAQTYGQYDNVIFELLYEVNGSVKWSTIKDYADRIIEVIREYSDNLILVATPNWSQHVNEPVGNEVTDSKNNTAYVFHYWAGSHSVGSFGSAVETAMSAGLSVFISEWGTTDVNADGSVNASSSSEWQTFVNAHKLSWTNRSASKRSETSAAFDVSATQTSLQYTASGKLVKSFLATNPTTYTACKGK